MLEREQGNIGSMTFGFIWRFVLFFVCACATLGFLVYLISAFLPPIFRLIMMLAIVLYAVYLASKLSLHGCFQKKHLNDNKAVVLRYKYHYILYCSCYIVRNILYCIL